MSEEDDADRLEQLLDRVESLRERHERTKLGTPLLGSNEAPDRRHSLGERPGIVASIKARRGPGPHAGVARSIRGWGGACCPATRT
jgi:hypothetical protein